MSSQSVESRPPSRVVGACQDFCMSYDSQIKATMLAHAMPEDESVIEYAKNGIADESGNRTAIGDFAQNAWGSFRHALVQAPARSIAQIVDHVAGSELEKKTDFWERPQAAEFGSAAWLGQAVGGTIGAALPFIAFHKAAGPGAATRLETSSGYALLSRSTAGPILKSVAAGAAYNAVLTPVEDGEDFLSGKIKSTVVGGVTWGVLTGTAIGIKSLGLRSFNKAINEAVALESGKTAAGGSGVLGSAGRRIFSIVDPVIAKEPVRAVLKNDLFAATAGGVVAGAGHAQMYSIASGRGFASAGETAESSAMFAVGGIMLGGANMIREKIAPSTGIKGVRTLEDMTRLADRTVKKGHPARFQFEEITTPQGGKRFVEANGMGGRRLQTMLARELEPTSLPSDVKTRISRGVHDLVTSYDAIQNIEPIVTVYGSARPKPNHFAYQRARYLGGRLAEEGYAVMTGGGPGIMEGANRGAYQAKGRSIGISLELPNEQMGNGYQNIVLKHAEFHTRKEILRNHKAAVVEMGGYGTLDEFAEVLTHIQTRKKEGTPLYLIESRATRRFDRYVKELVREGTISKGDRDLYKMVKGPDDIVGDLVAQRNRSNTTQPSAGLDGFPLVTAPSGIAYPNAQAPRWFRRS